VGSIDGIDVDDFPYVVEPDGPFLAQGRFTDVFVTHGGCDS
jgi:hypothetical protein